MPRIVSLLPSATEIVSALGFADDLVGRSHECDHPPGVERLPALTAPRLEPLAPSAEIDRRVRELLRDALSIYELDVEALQDLQPEVVVTQTQCDVCAVPLEQVQDAAARCLRPDTRLVALEPSSLDAVWDDMRRVAAALDVPERGETLVNGLRAAMDEIEARAAALPGTPSVVTLEWVDPLMSGGNWMPELVRRAGGREILARAERPSPTIAWDDLREADPDAILVIPCGFDLERTRTEANALRDLPGWRDLRAVRNGRVALADGHRFFNRPGPRLLVSLQILAEFLHPETFNFGHQDIGWEAMQ